MPYTMESLFASLPTMFAAAGIKGLNTSVQLHVTGAEAGDWYVVTQDDQLTVTKGVLPTAEFSASADSADIIAMAEDRLDPLKAFMLGKLKVKGDMSEIVRLVQLVTRK